MTEELRALIVKWREAAEWEITDGSPEFGKGLDQAADDLEAALRAATAPQGESMIELLKLASAFDDALGRCNLYGNADQVRDRWFTLKFALIEAHKSLTADQG